MVFVTDSQQPPCPLLMAYETVAVFTERYAASHPNPDLGREVMRLGLEIAEAIHEEAGGCLVTLVHGEMKCSLDGVFQRVMDCLPFAEIARSQGDGTSAGQFL